MSEKGKSRLKTVGMVVIITLLGKILGLARDMMLGHNFGTGMEAQAFTMASRIPRIFFDSIFASAISSSFIPIFNEYMEKKGKKEAYELSSSFFTWVGLITVLMAVLGMVFSEQLTGLFSDYTGETAALSSYLLRILFPTIVFTGIAFSMVGVLQSMGQFNIPAAMSIVSNGAVILYYIFFNDTFGIEGLAVAFLVGWALQALIQIPFLVKNNFRYRPSLKNDGLKKILVLMLPVMVSTWIQPINLSVSLKFASGLFGGAGATAIEYANTLYTIVAGVLVLSLLNVIFPEMSRLTANDRKEEFGEIIKGTTRTLLFILIPMTVGLMVLSTPIIRLLYEWGNWDSFSTEITSRSLFYLSLGIVGYGLQSVLSRGFYALKNGRVPLISGVCSIAVNLLLCMALKDRFDVAGLALASGISLTVAAVMQSIAMQRMTGSFITKTLLLDTAKMTGAALAMGLAAIGLRNLTEIFPGDGLAARALTVLIPAGVGVAIYFALTKILGIPEADQIFAVLKKFLRRGEADV